MGHLIKNSKEHTSLFVPVYCVREIEDQDSSSGIAGQSHKYDTRFPHENRSYNPQDSVSATLADEAKKHGMSPSVVKEKQKEALKMVEHKKEEARREQEKAESKERRFKMQQIKNELQIGEIEGFDDTMLDLKRQAKIMEDLECQKKNKQGQMPYSQKMFQQQPLQQGIHSQGLQPQGMNNSNMPQLDPYQMSTSQNYQSQQCNLSPNNSNWQGENPSYSVERQHSTEFHQILRAETNNSEPYRQMEISYNMHRLEVGDAIQIGSNPIYGTIKWIGELSGSRGLLAGVEMVRKLCTIYLYF